MPATTTVSITNHLATAVEIYDQFDPSTAAAPNQPYTYTLLKTVAPGATAEVTTIREVALLVATLTGAIAELNGDYYRRFPIKAMSGTQVTFGNPAPLAYTIEDTDRQAAIASFQFHRFAMANPSSVLTKNFNAALKAGFEAVNDFFQKSANFKKCTMATWHLVMAWLENSTSGWQGPYFLYETPPSPLPENYKPNLVATLSITSDATTDSAVLTLCTSDDQGNPVYATPTSQTTLAMSGGATMQDAEPGSDTPVSLTPVWMNVIQTPMKDGKPTPQYLIGKSVTGTVGNISVTSSQTALQLPGQPPKADSDSGGFEKLFSKLVEVIGALAGLVAIYEFAAKKFGKGEGAKEAAKKEAKDPADLEERQKAVDKETQTELDDPKDGLPALEEAAPAAAEKVSAGYADTVKQMQTDTLNKTIDDNVAAVEEQVQTDIENGATPSDGFEKAWSNMQTSAEDAKGKIADGDFDSWKDNFKDSMSDMKTAVAAEETNLQQKVGEFQQDCQDAVEQSESLENASQEYEESSQDEASDGGYDADEDNEPPETDEVPPVEAPVEA
jgi:hypothetical protein